jgi:hypothetical protein
MNKVFLFVLFAIFAQRSFGQNTPEEMVTKFFNEYERNPAKAVEKIYASNVWTSRIKDGIVKMQQQVNSYTEDYMGKYYGYDPIVKKQLAERFVLCSYLARYERQPIRFTFEFYKPNDKWTLFAFKIDSDLDDEMEQEAKLFYLNLEKK